MPLNSSGPISIGGPSVGQSINLELGRAAGATSSLNETALRTLAGVPSGTIALNNFYGKSSYTAPTSVEYLVVAGGGGGAGGYAEYGADLTAYGGCVYDWVSSGGGGGAGGFRTGTLSTSGSTTYTVTVGAGGNGQAGIGNFPDDAPPGGNGSNSVFGSITSDGGGGGAHGQHGAATLLDLFGRDNGSRAMYNGISGGSGGGGSYGYEYCSSGGYYTDSGLGSGGSASPGQGNAGGSAGFVAGGGGGGAGAVGGTGQSGNGGNGTASSISGTSVTYAGGGAGGYGSLSGGSGGGGAPGVSGTTNSGGGGGGSSNPSTAGNGGSGIVIIRYLNTFSDPTTVTGTHTVTNSGGYKIYRWTGSGSIRW